MVMTELPIACTLEVSEAGARLERWRRLSDQTGAELRATANGLSASFPRAADVAHELDELVRLERQCCGFASWSVSEQGGTLRLDVVAGDRTGVQALQEMFGAAEPKPTV